MNTSRQIAEILLSLPYGGSAPRSCVNGVVNVRAFTDDLTHLSVLPFCDNQYLLMDYLDDPRALDLVERFIQRLPINQDLHVVLWHKGETVGVIATKQHITFRSEEVFEAFMQGVSIPVVGYQGEVGVLARTD